MNTIPTMGHNDILRVRLAMLKREHRDLDDAIHALDRKSTRLNSSHVVISHAVFCLKKQKK